MNLRVFGTERNLNAIACLYGPNPAAVLKALVVCGEAAVYKQGKHRQEDLQD